MTRMNWQRAKRFQTETARDSQLHRAAGQEAKRQAYLLGRPKRKRKPQTKAAAQRVQQFLAAPPNARPADKPQPPTTTHISQTTLWDPWKEIPYPTNAPKAKAWSRTGHITQR